MIIIKRLFSRHFLAFLALAALCAASHAASAAPPQKILSLSPAATEILFDLGLGDRVVGVTDYCTWPPEAKSKQSVGDMMHVNMETVVSMDPDIVVVSSMNTHIESQIKALGYPAAVVGQDNFEEVLDSMLRVGEACGVEDTAKRRVGELIGAVEALTLKPGGKDGKKPPRVLVVVGRDIDDTSFKKTYVAGPRSFYNDLLNRSAAVNAYPDDLLYANVSQEGLLRMDPDLIIELVGEHGMTNVDTKSILAQWKKVKDLRAAQSGNVAVIRGDFAFRVGPRYPLVLEAFKKAIHDGVREIRE
ncbi:MAG: helical backbone metal receptor [Synergistaceae bacterium]|nr:helical backbone metal receptor [Synergistaceae bacterium]